MATFQFRPLKWDRPETDPRLSGNRFRAVWSDTIETLKREVDVLGGEAIALQIDTTEDQIRRNGMLRSSAKVGHPGVLLSFTSVHGPLTYATDRYDHWKSNVRATALGLQALRAVDRYGITSRGEQYTGWAELADKPFAPDARAQAASVLVQATGISVTVADLLADATKVTEAYRSAVQRHHPDHGGSAQVFVRIQRARETLLGR